MASIPASQAVGLFTQALIATYRERVRPSAFLRSFFRNEEKLTKYLSIEVLRGTEKIAVDVLRGSEGNRNRFTRSVQKIIEPPYYREYFDITELDLYDRLFGATSIDGVVFAELVKETVAKMELLVDKIERAYELQCAQVLQTGIVTVADGTNIDFKRKAGSLINNSANPWTGTADANNPYTQIKTAITWLRTNGKAQGGTFNMIMGGAASTALFNNAAVLAKGPLSNINFDQLRAPQRESVGGTTLGVLTAGDYKVNLWSYPEYYDDAAGNSTPYIDPKKVIILPENPNFILGFAAVPQLIDEQNPMPKKGAYVFGDYRDQRKSTHVYDVKSAGVAIPVAVDQIVTMQVVA